MVGGVGQLFAGELLRGDVDEGAEDRRLRRVELVQQPNADGQPEPSAVLAVDADHAVGLRCPGCDGHPKRIAFSDNGLPVLVEDGMSAANGAVPSVTPSKIRHAVGLAEDITPVGSNTTTPASMAVTTDSKCRSARRRAVMSAHTKT